MSERLSPAQIRALRHIAAGRVAATWLRLESSESLAYTVSSFDGDVPTITLRALLGRGLIEPGRRSSVRLTEAGRLVVDELGLDQ